MYHFKFQLYLFVCLLIFMCSCGQARSGVKAQPLPTAIDTVSYVVLGQPKEGNLTIKDTIDLENRKCVLPEEISLNFKGGLVKNGTLVGNNTKLRSSGACFDRVRIMGTWSVPVISTSLFCNLNYDNALKDVVALSNPAVKNKIIIGRGDYQVSAYKNGDVCLPVNSNTELVINGTIRLTPNNFTNYYILQAEGHDIKIKGKGTILGDKHTHTGKKGEWGMGINLDHAHNVMIKGLTIKDCWGDCIYVGNESSDVRIEDCLLDHGRRQGISITSADGVIIKNCTITNVGGTAPEYAIDVEPNKRETVDNVVIENVITKNCRGGFLVYGKAPLAHVGKVTMRNCRIEASRKMPISIIRCSLARVERCITRGSGRKDDINMVEVETAIKKNNRKE